MDLYGFRKSVITDIEDLISKYKDNRIKELNNWINLAKLNGDTEEVRNYSMQIKCLEGINHSISVPFTFDVDIEIDDYSDYSLYDEALDKELDKLIESQYKTENANEINDEEADDIDDDIVIEFLKAKETKNVQHSEYLDNLIVYNGDKLDISKLEEKIIKYIELDGSQLILNIDVHHIVNINILVEKIMTKLHRIDKNKYSKIPEIKPNRFSKVRGKLADSLCGNYRQVYWRYDDGLDSIMCDMYDILKFYGIHKIEIGLEDSIEVMEL